MSQAATLHSPRAPGPRSAWKSARLAGFACLGGTTPVLEKCAIAVYLAGSAVGPAALEGHR